MSRPTFVDLFSGCGGFGLGATLAGFDCMLAVDNDPDLQSSYALNFPCSKIINADVGKFFSSSWASDLAADPPDLLIGGPPCQGFSTIGKQKDDDPRNRLIHYFFHVVNFVRPRFFIMENVPGLLSPQKVELLKSAISIVSGSYDVLKPLVLDASQYGIPTKRKRMFLIGSLRFGGQQLSEADFQLKQATVRVVEAIRDLPAPLNYQKGEDYGWSRLVDVSDDLADYAKIQRRLPPDNLGWQISINNLKRGSVSGFQPTIHSEIVSARYSRLGAHQVDVASKSKRLCWSGQSPTLRAGTGKDKGSFQAVRPIHPSVGRVITVREAARLQSFPDWFVFHPTKWHSFRMIGNSVPPLLAKQIIRCFLAKI